MTSLRPEARLRFSQSIPTAALAKKRVAAAMWTKRAWPCRAGWFKRAINCAWKKIAITIIPAISARKTKRTYLVFMVDNRSIFSGAAQVPRSSHRTIMSLSRRESFKSKLCEHPRAATFSALSDNQSTVIMPKLDIRRGALLTRRSGGIGRSTNG